MHAEKKTIDILLKMDLYHVYLMILFVWWFINKYWIISSTAICLLYIYKEAIIRTLSFFHDRKYIFAIYSQFIRIIHRNRDIRFHF